MMGELWWTPSAQQIAAFLRVFEYLRIKETV
jgi:hypothetical protein